MGAMASQTTSLTIVYPTVYLGTDQRKTSKLSLTGLCKGNLPVTGEFPAYSASNAENAPFDDFIMMILEDLLGHLNDEVIGTAGISGV